MSGFITTANGRGVSGESNSQPRQPEKNSPGRPDRKANGGPHTGKILLQGLLVYAVAAAIIWYELRWVNLKRVLKTLDHAHLKLFVATTLTSFLVWFLGENLLFARLFSCFHQRTRYREVLPATAVSYFLQAVNILVSSGALVVFLHRRKGADWLAAGFTITFLGFIDGIMFSASISMAGLFLPNSLSGECAPYAGAAFACFSIIAAWWMWRTPRFGFERWLRERPSLVCFRKANPAIYGELLAIRFAILAPQGFLFWLCMRAFEINVPLVEVLALAPLIFSVAGVPITPVGLGSLQAVAMIGLAPFAARSAVFAMSFAFSVFQLLYRIPLGLISAQIFIRMVIGSEEEADAPIAVSRASVSDASRF